MSLNSDDEIYPRPRPAPNGLDAESRAQSAVSTWARQVVDVNQQLILASLQAERTIEATTHQLAELTHSAQRDALTGTPNRVMMLDRLQQAVASAKRQRTRFAVLFIDLDGFKKVNDDHGHAAGDRVLIAVARVIEAAVRRSDTVSRHGGDEYLVLLPDISRTCSASMIAKKILAALAVPIPLGPVPLEVEEISLAASIGIATFPDDGDDPAMLIHRADQAMYRSKERRPGSYAFYCDPPEAARRDSSHFSAGIPLPTNATADAASRDVLSEVTPRFENSKDGQPIALEQDAQPEGFDREAAYHAVVAEALHSPFISGQQAVQLLRQVQTTDPLFQMLLDRDIAHLASPLYEAFDVRQAALAKFTRFSTVKCGTCNTIDDDGAPHVVIEFDVTGRSSALDQSVRSATEKSFGLVNGDRVHRLTQVDFQVAGSGRVLHRL